MKSLILATAAAVAFLFAGSEDVQAGHGYGYNPYVYNGGHVHHGVNPWYSPGFGGHYDYHNTSHFDYVPTRYIRHRNHIHVQPGGYQLHRTGHWDLHH